MSDQENFDVSRVIGVIMENPQLIEQISGLMKQRNNDADESQSSSVIKTESSNNADNTNAESAASANPILPRHRGNRAQLLGALKPYVSEERARAIDSVISIADILDMMRAR